MTSLTHFTADQLLTAAAEARAYSTSRSPAARVGPTAAAVRAAKVAAYAALPTGAVVATVDADGEIVRQYTKLPNAGPTEYVADEDGNRWHASADTSLFDSSTNLAVL